MSMPFHSLFLCWDKRVGHWAEGEENGLFFKQAGECDGKRTALSFIEKFGHGELTVLVS